MPHIDDHPRSTLVHKRQQVGVRTIGGKRMRTGQKCLAMLCVASLFIVCGGCSDDDDPVVRTQQVTADQAEVLIEDAIPFILEFGPDIADLMEAIFAKNAAAAGDLRAQQECTPIPGLEADFFCMDPGDGEICPVTEGVTELVFTDCVETVPDPGMLDGMVTVTEAGSTLDLLFALGVDDGSINGGLEITYGDCLTLTYDSLVIEEGGVENTINGSTEICPVSNSGILDVTVNATGIASFLMELEFAGVIPTISVVTPSGLPILNCTYNPVTERATCLDIL
jgi:hypothetical protein